MKRNLKYFFLSLQKKIWLS